jgi:hypothetical protein
MATQHFKQIAQRLVNAEAIFVEILMERGRIDRELANKVFALYRKHKVIKLDAFNGMYRVTYGAALDRETIQGAAKA